MKEESPEDAPSLEGFPPEEFQARRRAIQEALGDAVLVLPAAPLLHRSRDSEYPYRPSSELFYATGATEEGSVALLRGREAGGEYILFVRPRDTKAERWSGPRLGPEGARELLGPDQVHTSDELEAILPGLLVGPARIYYRLGADTTLDRHVRMGLERGRSRGPRRGTGPRELVDPGEVLDELRLRKSPREIERMRRAARVTVEGHREAMGWARPGSGEWEIQAEVEAVFRRMGARGPAFPTIAGSGKNGCVLHYVGNGRRTCEGDLVLLDAGAEVGLYAGDVTRTFPVSGRFRAEQKDVYEVVLAAHRAALGAVGPGEPFSHVHRAAVQALTEGLVALGVLEGDVDELVEAKAHEAYFPHRTSHWLGLDVHDVGDYARNGQSRVLEPGMVLTVEPGLYFPSNGDPEPGPYDGIGVRIEDDVLVTEDGMENLTADLPVEIDDVEARVGVRWA